MFPCSLPGSSKPGRASYLTGPPRSTMTATATNPCVRALYDGIDLEVDGHLFIVALGFAGANGPVGSIYLKDLEYVKFRI